LLLLLGEGERFLGFGERSAVLVFLQERLAAHVMPLDEVARLDGQIGGQLRHRNDVGEASLDGVEHRLTHPHGRRVPVLRGQVGGKLLRPIVVAVTQRHVEKEQLRTVGLIGVG
jgi:hypothetical protein